jgi:hypothetical protein
MDNLSLKGALNLNKLHGGLNENKFKAAWKPITKEGKFEKWLNNHFILSKLNGTTDGKNNPNFLLLSTKSNIKDKGKIKIKLNKNEISSDLRDDLLSRSKENFYSWNLFNKSKNYRYKDIKSSNLSFLTSEKNLRLTSNQKLTKFSRSFESDPSGLSFQKIY